MRIIITPTSGPPLVFSDGSWANLVQSMDEDHVAAITRSGLTGWYEAPEVREQPVDRPQDDGAYWPGRLTVKPRVVTIRAHTISRGRSSSLETARWNDMLNALTGQRVTISVEDQQGVREATGYLSAQMAWEHACGVTRITLIFTCPDPSKYGVEVGVAPVAGMLLVDNTGTAPTWPRVTVEGHVTGVQLDMDGHVIKWEGDAPRLAFSTRDMIPSSGRFAIDDVVPLTPGRHRVRVQLSGDAPQLTMLLRPAWR